MTGFHSFPVNLDTRLLFPTPELPIRTMSAVKSLRAIFRVVGGRRLWSYVKRFKHPTRVLVMKQGKPQPKKYITQRAHVDQRNIGNDRVCVSGELIQVNARCG